MSYRHNFGSHQDSIRVDGQDYTYAVYQKLPNKEARGILRDEAVSRCAAVSQRRTSAFREAMEPHRDAFRASLRALESLPRFAKRYRGRAADMRSEDAILRNELNRKIRAFQDALEPSDGCTYPAAVHDVFFAWEEACETDYERYTRLVSNHDWYYAYSDDHSVWSSGNRVCTTICALLTSFKETEEHAEAAQLLYNQKCPWLNDDGTQKADH